MCCYTTCTNDTTVCDHKDLRPGLLNRVEHVCYQPVGRINVIYSLRCASNATRGTRRKASRAVLCQCGERGHIQVVFMHRGSTKRISGRTRLTKRAKIVERAQIVRNVRGKCPQIALTSVRLKLLGVGQKFVPEMSADAKQIARIRDIHNVCLTGSRLRGKISHLVQARPLFTYPGGRLGDLRHSGTCL